MRQWQEGMGEISGFGGSYEEGCRAMFLAGIEWIDNHPDAELKVGGFKNVFGLTQPKSPDAVELEETFLNAKVTMEDGREVRCGSECTGAMVHAIWNHLFAYKKLGWDEYVKKMSEP